MPVHINSLSGARGALLDEYDRAVKQLWRILEEVAHEEFLFPVDPAAENPDFHAIQTILSHMVNSGYAYANYIRRLKKAPAQPWRKIIRQDLTEYRRDFSHMMQYTAETFGYFSEEEVEQHDNQQKMLTHWGQLYDIEQLMEHAIVHILRHRRQIERYLRIIRNSKNKLA